MPVSQCRSRSESPLRSTSNQRRRQLEASLGHVYLTKYGVNQKRAAIKWKRIQNLKPAALNAIAVEKKKFSQKISSSNRVSKIHGFLSQRNIKGLLKQTNYDRRELYVMYVRYKALCAMSPFPNGIGKATFKKGVARLAVEDDLFVDRVFDLVDEDGSGCIEWPEFLSAMSALEKGNQSKKMTFFLRTYDLDGDGFVSRSDLYAMLLSSCMLEPDEVTVDLVNTFVERLFETLGAADKDKLSLDEIIVYMNSINNSEDVWEVFGRSMLRDFGGPKIRRHPEQISGSGLAEMS